MKYLNGWRKFGLILISFKICFNHSLPNYPMYLWYHSPYLLFNFTLIAHLGTYSYSRYRMSSTLGIDCILVSNHLLIKHGPYKIWEHQIQHTFIYSEPTGIQRHSILRIWFTFPENVLRCCINMLGFWLINVSCYLVINFSLKT